MRGFRLKLSDFEFRILMALLAQHSTSTLPNVSKACISIKEQIQKKTKPKEKNV